MIDPKLTARALTMIALCSGVAAVLSGCVEMVVGTAVIGGTLAATDRRTFGAQTEDKEIAFKGELRASKLAGDAGHVDVNSFNRKVLLTGEVKDEAMKAAIERDVGAVEGVKAIVNELEIGTASSFTSRSIDFITAGKVSASFVDSKELYANLMKVVAERGVVYLMGCVTQREGKLAAQIASGVTDVRKVVMEFEYIGEDELKRIVSK